MSNTKETGGFSLIEVAIGLLIVGLIVGPMIESYGAWKVRMTVESTNGNAADAESALTKYVKNYGCYPLPAAPGLASSNANAGMEVVRTTGDCTDLTAGQLAGIPICAGSDAVVCKVPCTVIAGSNCATLLGPVILIGDIPYATLGMPKDLIVDGYGRKYTYAVSSNLTGLSNFNNSNGVVTVVNLNGKGPGALGPCDGSPVTDGHYALISHGKDGAGAYTIEGALAASCPAQGVDKTNCSYTGGTFNDGYDKYNDQNGQECGRLANYNAGASHFDDFVYYLDNIYTDYWTKEATGGSVGDIVSNIQNANVKIKQPNSGNGAADPQAKLDIRGDLTADAVQTPAICDTSLNSYVSSTYRNMPCQPDNVTNAATTNGFSPANLGGAPDTDVSGNPTKKTGNHIHCGVTVTVTGSLAAIPLQGIASADEVCGSTTGVTAQPAYAITPCPAGQWAYGIDGSGNRLCSTVPHP